MKPTKEECAWISGLFEGEGCISWTTAHRKNRNIHRQCTLSIHMTDEDVLRKFHSIVKVGNFYGPYASRKPHHKIRWMWAVQNFKDCEYVMHLMLPWLCTRRKARWQQLIDLEKNERPNGKIVPFGKGVGNIRAKISEDTARDILKEYNNGSTNIAALSRKFNVSYHITYKLVTGTTWQHIQEV